MNRGKFALGLVALLGAMPAAAHHSFDLTFDRDELVRVTGKVTEFQFANPHAFFTLEVVDPDGTKQEWHVETSGAAFLSSHGWDRSSVKPGEVLEVDGWAARNGTRYIRMRSMNHADGSAVGLFLPPGPTAINGG